MHLALITLASSFQFKFMSTCLLTRATKSVKHDKYVPEPLFLLLQGSPEQTCGKVLEMLELLVKKYFEL